MEIVNPKEFGLEESKANEIKSGLKTILEERELLISAYDDVLTLEITEETLPTFRDLRLKIRDNRTKGIEKWHKVNKEFFLTGGRFVDAIKNKEVAENERMEDALLKAEKHFENLEKERLLKIHNERLEKLKPFNYEVGNTDLASMDEGMFNAILIGAETTYNKKIEDEKQAELTRQISLRLEAEEKEKQRLELERLRKENEAKDLLAKEAKAKANAELAEANRLAKIEADKQKAINDKLQAELKAKADAEEKIKQDQIKSEQLRLDELNKAAKAPDKDKLNLAIDECKLNSLILSSEESQKVYSDILVKLDGFKKWAKTQIDLL